jgi:hypothetical protein
VLHYPNIEPYFFRDLVHSSDRGFTRRPFGDLNVKEASISQPFMKAKKKNGCVQGANPPYFDPLK